MSTLPNIDAAVSQELNSQLSVKNFESIQFKALAEALLTERDALQEELDKLKEEISSKPISGTIVED